jgi:4-hydroxybenzoate polyprenyltransferase
MSAAQPARAMSVVLALRPHQWAKNLLVFVPLLLTPHLVGDASRHRQALLAFAAMSLCASAGYVVNDLLDLEADRGHPSKRQRPFASGALSIRTGIVLIAVLGFAGAGVALATSRAGFMALLALYAAATVSYSLWLKRLLLVDILTLAGLYTLRVLAGAAAVDITPTPWLLAFSLFIFTSLALVKRYSELQLMAELDVSSARGRAYRVEDRDLIAMLGTSTACLSVLVLCLYINSQEVRKLYEQVALLWLLCPLLLYWVGRIWFLAKRGDLPGDPVAFAIKDPASLVTGLLSAAVLAAAILL